MASEHSMIFGDSNARIRNGQKYNLVTVLRYFVLNIGAKRTFTN